MSTKNKLWIHNSLHLFVEYKKFADMMRLGFQKYLKQAHRRIYIRESSRRLEPEINEEDIDYSQRGGISIWTWRSKNQTTSSKCCKSGEGGQEIRKENQ